MSQAWGLCGTGTSIRATQPLSKPVIMNICREQLLPACASAELCRDVLVEMIILLWGSREDGKKTAPSQLLQGVLQCRGATEKYEASRQCVQQSAAHSLSPFPAMPYFFHSSLLSSFTSTIPALSTSLKSVCVSHTHTHTHKHTHTHTHTQT